MRQFNDKKLVIKSQAASDSLPKKQRRKNVKQVN